MDFFKKKRYVCPVTYPTVYPSHTNVLLIDTSVPDYNTFYTSVNSDTFPILYSTSSLKSELLKVLKDNFTSIRRIAFVFASTLDKSCLFLDENPLFVENETVPYSKNLQFIINIIKTFKIQHVDFLACNTLEYSTWNSFYSILFNETSVTVGASNDKTGNIKYGGDWVLESTEEDIELVYFNKSIEYYSFLLDASWSSIVSYWGIMTWVDDTMYCPSYDKIVKVDTDGNVSDWVTINIDNLSSNGTVAHGSYLYVSCDNGDIYRVNLDSKQYETWFTLSNPLGMVVHNEYLYVSSGNYIYKINLNNTADYTKIFFTTNFNAFALAVDGDYLYVSKYNNIGSICKINLNNTSDFTSEWFTIGLSNPTGLVVNNGYLYVANENNNTIIRIKLSDKTYITFATSSDGLYYPVGMSKMEDYLYVFNWGSEKISKHNMNYFLLTPPTNLQVTLTTTAALSFTAPENADENTVYTATLSNGNTYNSTGSESILLTGLSLGTYTFTVTATNYSGTSFASNPVTFTIYPILESLTNLEVSFTTTTTAALSFTAPENADENTVYTAMSSNGDTYNSTGSESILLTGLSLGTYTFTVTATNYSGTSESTSITFPNYRWYSNINSYWGSMALQNNFIYVLSDNSIIKTNLNKNIVVNDWITQSIIETFINFDSEMFSLATDETYLYIGYSNGYIVKVHLTSKNITLVTNSFGEWVSGLLAHNNCLYASIKGTGIVKFDLSDNTHSTFSDKGDEACNLIVHDNYLYIAYDGNVEKINLNDDDDFTTIYFGGSTTGVAIYNNCLYTSCEKIHEVKKFDLSTNDHSFFVSDAQGINGPDCLLIVSNYLLVYSWVTSEIFIFSLSETKENLYVIYKNVTDYYNGYEYPQTLTDYTFNTSINGEETSSVSRNIIFDLSGEPSVTLNGSEITSIGAYEFTIDVSQLYSQNYEFSSGNNPTLTILQKENLYVICNDITKYYNANAYNEIITTDYSFNTSIDGGETSSVSTTLITSLTGIVKVTSNESPLQVGTYSFTVDTSKLYSYNYTFTPGSNITLNIITKEKLYIIYENKSVYYNGYSQTFTLNYSYNTSIGGEESSNVPSTSIKNLTGELTSLSGETTNVGTYEYNVDVTGLSSDNYDFILGNNPTLTILPKQLFLSATKVYDGTTDLSP